jgi:hypothetical protein
LQENVKHYPIIFYLLLILLAIFYIFIFPLTVIKVMESEAFVKLCKEFEDVILKKSYNYMDSNTVRNSGDSSRSIITGNRNENRIIVPDSNVEVSGNVNSNVMMLFLVV